MGMVRGNSLIFLPLDRLQCRSREFFIRDPSECETHSYNSYRIYSHKGLPLIAHLASTAGTKRVSKPCTCREAHQCACVTCESRVGEFRPRHPTMHLMLNSGSTTTWSREYPWLRSSPPSPLIHELPLRHSISPKSCFR